MRIFGLTGGIASGKSLVATRLAEHGAVVVDADALSRDAVAPGSPGLAAVAEAFGPSVLTVDGALDRAAMGALIFTDPEARARLNAIVHPEVRRLGEERIAAAAAADPDTIVVYDIPLLVEAGPARREPFEGVIVVVADEEERVRRMVKHRGMAEAEARSRIAAQATDAERLAIATEVVDNTGAVETALAQVDAIWDRIASTAAD